MFLKITSIYSIGFVFLIYAQLPAALNPKDDSIRSLILQGLDFSYTNRFEEADRVFERLIQAYPHHPVGYFYKTANLQAQMLDAEEYEREQDFYRFAERTIQLAESLQTADQADSWILFYKGSAFIYRSFMKMKIGNWLSAYKDASRGVGLLEEALALDSLLYDAYLGIGSFKYWKSAKAEFLLWLPFLSDQREQGIAMIYKAIEKGEYVRPVGRDQLVWILMDKKEYKEAFNLALQNHEAYPSGRFFKWSLASAAFRLGEWEISRRLYQELLTEIQQLPQNNHLNEIECLVKMAEIAAQNGQWTDAYQLSDRALRFNLNESVRKRAKNKLQKALALRREAEQRIQP